jgi:hypothetical protein
MHNEVGAEQDGNRYIGAGTDSTKLMDLWGPMLGFCNVFDKNLGAFI